MQTNRLLRFIAVGIVLLLCISVGAYLLFRPRSPITVVATVDVPVGEDMVTQIKKGTTIYRENVPDFALKKPGASTEDFSATVKVLNVLDTRTVIVEILSPTTFKQQPGNIGYLYLCTPLSEKANKLPDGTLAYGGNGYPQIIAGSLYEVKGVLQPHCKDYPFVYVPGEVEFMQIDANAEQVVREYFTYWNEKNVTEMERRMTPNRKGITWEFDKLEYVKLISIKEIKARQEGIKVFEVVFDIKFKDGSDGGSGLSDGEYTWGYLLKRDNETSSWLIYDWGGGRFLS